MLEISILWFCVAKIQSVRIRLLFERRSQRCGTIVAKELGVGEVK